MVAFGGSRGRALFFISNLRLASSLRGFGRAIGPVAPRGGASVPCAGILLVQLEESYMS